MKKGIGAGAVLLLVLAGLPPQTFLAVSAPATAQARKIEKQAAVVPAVDPLVTFVELGSVKCVPCKAMQPVMAEIEKEYGARVKVVFHDVWTAAGRPFAEQYRIRAIPTQVFLDKDGTEFFRHTGFFSKEEITAVLKKQGVK